MEFQDEFFFQIKAEKPGIIMWVEWSKMVSNWV